MVVIIILRVVTQNQKDRHCMLFTLTWGIIDDTAFPPNIAHKFKKPATGKCYLFWVVQSVESTRSIPLLPLQTSLLRLPIADTRVTGHGKTKPGPTWNLHIYWLAHCMLKREIFNKHGPCTIMTNWAYWYAHWCNIRPIMERTNYFLND